MSYIAATARCATSSISSPTAAFLFPAICSSSQGSYVSTRVKLKQALRSSVSWSRIENTA